jgi:hypothetical protein
MTLHPDDLLLFEGSHEAFHSGIVNRATFQRDVAALHWNPPLSTRALDALIEEARPLCTEAN